MKQEQALIIILAVIISLLFFQNCSSSYPVGESSHLSEVEITPGPDTDENNEDDFSIDIDDIGDGPITDKGVSLLPKDLKNLTATLLLESPEDCERTCKEQQCLGTVDENSEQLLQACLANVENCENNLIKTCIQESITTCSRDKGLCRPLKIHPDPYTLESFTVPGGYRKAQVVVEHCTDRNDVLVIEGPYFYFKTLNSGDLWNARFGANVGRGPRCKKEGLLDIAKVRIRTTDTNGKFHSEKEYIWKSPAYLSFPMTNRMITDMDDSEPVFAHYKGAVGPGAKLHKIYDNYHLKGQLSFIMEYIFWYDPKYTTIFDFYYKKKSNTVSN